MRHCQSKTCQKVTQNKIPYAVSMLEYILYFKQFFLSIILIFFVVGFDNEQVSIQVNGGAKGTTLCCWGVYSETAFQGEVLYVRYDAHNKGIYNSAQDMGKLFKDATSIQLLDKNCGVPY